MTDTIRLTADDLYSALKVRYAAPEYALLPQATNGTGWRAKRWLDAVAMSLWPSRGISMHGFEIKIARYDWLREKKNPEKAEALFTHLDFFSVVALDDRVVEDGELPPTWGLLVFDAAKSCLRQKVIAPALHPEHRATFDRDFVAGILRRVEETRISKAINTHGLKEFERGVKEGERSVRSRLGDDERARLNTDAFLHEASINWGTEAEAAAIGRVYKHLKELNSGYEGVPTLLKVIDKVRATARELDRLLTPAKAEAAPAESEHVA